ncbi:patatin [Rubrivirga sp. IMCC45206]|uniref:patatin n=1 Tax=Rubrivirga sp. IMCC45206 TaxID=3391614 RepID=UPI0039902575
MTTLRLVLLAIAAVTVVSGLVQALAPSFVLGLIGAEGSPGGNHSFGIVGMFMVLFGGLLWEGLSPRGPIPTALRWAGLQKLGAAGAVTLGVARDLFGPLALGVAGFDLLSGVLIFVYLVRAR